MNNRPIPILMYHSIQNEKKGSKLRGLSVPPFLFKIHMLTLKILGFKGLKISDLLPYIKGEKTGKVFGITFDDGYLNNFSEALPILKSFNFSSTCYLVSSNISGVNYWDIPNGVSPKKMMSEDDIKNWLAAGMEIGSHSVNHVRLAEIENKILIRNEVLNSKKDLEKRFKVSIDHFCYPYGSFSDRVLSIVEECGYHTAVTTKRSKVYQNSNIFKLPRVLVNHRTYLLSLLLKIYTRYEEKRNK